jgi:hypothetical protein
MSSPARRRSTSPPARFWWDYFHINAVNQPNVYRPTRVDPTHVDVDPYLKIVALDADGDSIGSSDLVSVSQ